MLYTVEFYTRDPYHRSRYPNEGVKFFSVQRDEKTAIQLMQCAAKTLTDLEYYDKKRWQEEFGADAAPFPGDGWYETYIHPPLCAWDEECRFFCWDIWACKRTDIDDEEIFTACTQANDTLTREELEQEITQAIYDTSDLLMKEAGEVARVIVSEKWQ